MNLRQLFLQHVAQTSSAPLSLEIVKASKSTLTDASGKNYIDLIGGISVANIGHSHPQLINAIRHQLDNYLHIMVYGEFVQSPQVKYAKLLSDNLPGALNSVYFTNSGAEAIEGAMKLAKRATGRSEICCFNLSYHGSTQGALSIIGSEYWRSAYRPLLPGIQRLNYNSYGNLELITTSTACVIIETVQAEAGIIVPQREWLQALARQCKETGTLLVVDEVQAGFGRTGKLWGFQHFDIIPDILVLGKALGGGLPLGAFIANRQLMYSLADNPVLGHITTFGGHPLCCTAGMAALEILLESEWFMEVKEKEQLFKQLLVHPLIKSVRSFGLWMAVEFDSFDTCKRVIDRAIEGGVLTDWFLFASNCLRISPPLLISKEEI
ncbi:MAG: aspartate aminotransferase family protein, partial [Candidatus Dadabacteria bacterium]